METLALLLGIGAEALLTAGGYIGGTIVFVYGVRVLKRLDVRVADALVPGHAERERSEQCHAGDCLVELDDAEDEQEDQRHHC